MKHKLFYTLGIVALAMLAFTASAKAQTSAAGPYYANPSWDQKLQCDTQATCPRFIVLSNMSSNAVLDRETGLVWQKSPSTSTFAWLDGQVLCNGLNTGGRLGWRLPTLQELDSLVDYDSTNSSSPRLPPGHPFTNVQSSFYWSATTVDVNTGSAWGVDSSDGSVGPGGKSGVNFVWCVRGGQGVDPQ